MTSRYRNSILASILIALPLSYVAGYQIIGESRDYLNYLSFFDLVRSAKNYSEISYRFEPGFTFIAYWLAHIGFGNEWIYGFFAGTCIYIKYSALPVFHENLISFLVFTFLFLCRYFILFEMTVLRAAVAFSIVFAVFLKKENEQSTIKEVFFLVLAALFHYSAIVFFPIYFIGKLTRKKIIVLSIFSFFLILFSEKLALTILPNIFPVFKTYGAIKSEATLLPAPMILDIALIVFGLVFWSENDLPMRYSIFGMTLSIVFHFAVLDFSVISGRIYEILSVFVLIYLVRAAMQKNALLMTLAVLFSIFDGAVNLYAVTIHEPLLS